MSDVIVEIATIITDDELNIIAEGPDLVIHQPEEVLNKMNEVVTNMHTESGLLNQITASTLSLDEAGRLTLDFIKEHCPEAGTVPLCGNSIGTDRRFLARYLPEIENYLHYRSVDVQASKNLFGAGIPRQMHADRGSQILIERSMTSRRAWPNCSTTSGLYSGRQAR